MLTKHKFNEHQRHENFSGKNKQTKKSFVKSISDTIELGPIGQRYLWEVIIIPLACFMCFPSLLVYLYHTQFPHKPTAIPLINVVKSGADWKAAILM